MSFNKYPIGTPVKLVSYDEYEYPGYKGETAIIIRHLEDSDFDYCVRWADEGESWIAHSNAIAMTTWKARYEAKK